MNSVYLARYGFPPRVVLTLVAAVAFTAVLIAFPAPIAARVLGIALFGIGGVVMLVNGISRKVALRVDQAGVTLGGAPLRYRATTLFVPWEDISRVVLWKQTLPPFGRKMPYVGVERRAGAAPLKNAQGKAARSVVRTLVPDVPADVVMTSRAVNGWQLDVPKLAAAVASCSPGTPLVDIQKGTDLSVVSA